ncbi:hypothetical protein I302_100526 [Kwoniella bestiolae CBS 10118]|uniref:Ubiquitin-like protease family profile domain-containing protein n=1 Tax=Kwoniella bestiolae CBS 10118 TaxID=1296100 RepID=A0AAJ8M5I0_9TREE
MEELALRQPRQSSSQIVRADSDSEEDDPQLVEDSRKAGRKEGNSGPAQGKPALPLDKMTALMKSAHYDNKATTARRKTERHSSTTTGSPFTPGKNNLDKNNHSPTVGKSQHTKNDVKLSRRPLAEPSHPSSSFTQPTRQQPQRIQMGGRQRIPPHLSHPPEATSTPRAGPSKIHTRNTHHPEPRHSQMTKESTSVPIDLLESEEEEPVEQRSNRRTSRSGSPEKPPSSGQRRPRTSPLPTYIIPPALGSSSGKGKGKMRNDGYYGDHSSPTKGFTSVEPLELGDDKIRDPEGIYEIDKNNQDYFEIVDNDPPGSHGRENQRQSPNERQMNLINQAMTRAGPKKGKAGHMRMKNGELPAKASAPTSNRTPLKDRITSSAIIPSSGIGQFSGAPAPIQEAWFSPDQTIMCDSVSLINGTLQIIREMGNTPLFWGIPLETITRAQICEHAGHPMLALDVSRVHPSQLQGFDQYMSQCGGSRSHLLNSNALPTLILVFKKKEAATKLLGALRKKLASEIIPETLDPPACEALRSSCNPQLAESSDTRTRLQEKRQKAAGAPSRRQEEEEVLRARPKGGRKSSAKDEEQARPPKSANKDKQVDDPNQMKLPFQPAPKPAVRRSMRKSGGTVHNVDGSDSEHSEVATKTKAVKPLQFVGDRYELLFPFPLTGRADVNITIGDAQRIETKEFLNDTLLEFGLRHVLAQLPKEKSDEVHLFNSFFYERLSDPAKKSKKGETFWPGYESVKKWSKGKDIFGKKFVVIPINENYHWFLAVIINPSGILRPKPSEDGSISPTHRPEFRTAASEYDGEDAAKVDAELATNSNNAAVTDSDLDDLNSDDEDKRSREPTPQTRKPLSARPTGRSNDTDVEMYQDDDNDVSRASIDPLDCIGPDEGSPVVDKPDFKVNQVSHGVENMEINSEDGNEGVDFVGSGAAIMTPTMLAVQQQNHQIRNPSQEPPAAAENLSRKRQIQPDARIIGSEDTWILTFDSLGGPHRAHGSQINMWLKYEAMDKKGVDYETTDAIYWEAKVPQQGNFHDCGLYVVHYAKQLLENPEEVLEFVQRRAPFSNTPGRQAWLEDKNKAWKDEETKDLRSTWAGMLGSLAEQYRLVKKSQISEQPKEDQPENADQNMQVDQDIGNTSQADSVTAIGASQFPTTSATAPEDLIPGAWPTPFEPDLPTEGKDSQSLSPPPPLTRSTSKSGPSWRTSTLSPPVTSKSPSADVHPQLRDNAIGPSVSPPKDSPNSIPVRNFTNHPSKSHNKTTPGRSSIQPGIVSSRRDQYELGSPPIGVSTGHVDPREGNRESEGLSDLRPYNPRPENLEDSSLTSNASTSVYALGSAVSESEENGSSMSRAQDQAMNPAGTSNSPFSNLGKGAPGTRNSNSASTSVHPTRPQEKSPVTESPTRTGRNRSSSAINMESDDEEEEEKNIFVSSMAESTRSQVHNQQQASSNLSSPSSEETEQVEDRSLPSTKQPMPTPKKITYASKDRGAQKRTRSESNHANGGGLTKRNKREETQMQGDEVSPGPGQTWDQAITIDSD